MMKNELISVAQLGEKHFGKSHKGVAMNKLLCDAGLQVKSDKRGYVVTEKGEPFAFKVEPGRYYWNPSVLNQLKKV